MATTYFRAEIDGTVYVRSTQTRPYAYCWLSRHGAASWTSRRDLIPADSSGHGKAQEITAQEYRDILKGWEIARAGGSETAAKLKKARDTLQRAQNAHYWAGQHIVVLNLQLGGMTARDLLETTGRWGNGEDFIAKHGVTELVRRQDEQRSAYARIEKARRDIAKLGG